MKNIRFILLLASIMTTFSAFSQEKNSGKNDTYFSVGEEVEVSNILSATTCRNAMKT